MNIFDLSLYKETDLEKWINTKYKDNGIHYASDIDIDRVAAIFDIEIRTYLGPSFADWEEDEYSFIFINGYLTEEQRRDVFFHELCHPIQHVGRQAELPAPFVELQEIQAGLFQLYSAMPAYMLEEFKTIQDRSYYLKVLSEEFVLPIRIVERRIAQMMRRINQEKSDQEFKKRMNPSPHQKPYMPETIQIIDQLQRQLSAKRLVTKN
ncbi:ImmA/IrrE family metallo-endopeptidase [Paenibacillus silvisoli]|uniref:ImmA/IrrE family metallo-endopeptidase n=1 Tax=Paenibacillus silvisoli TaxID=3110539 RepID=UPI0028037803|nr:ImmA/IrrE family metallo-endopeptidase [Paenibacillus silvisoli]